MPLDRTGSPLPKIEFNVRVCANGCHNQISIVDGPIQFSVDLDHSEYARWINDLHAELHKEESAPSEGIKQ